MADAGEGLLGRLTEVDRRAILASARRRRFAAREVVFHEGDPADCLHLVVAGRFAARSSTPLGDVVIIALFGVNDFFGEMALVDAHEPRTATIAALEAGQTMTLDRDAFESLRQSHAGIDRFLVEVLAARVRRTSVALLEASCERADIRVLRSLLHAAELWDAHGDAGGSVRLTQDEIAGLAGTTRVTVSKVLSDADRAGLIRTGRGRVDIIDAVGLRRRASAR